MIVELNARSREIFRRIVDAYVETGEPVGSRTLSRRLDEHLSPATIRNVMADLEEAGLLFAPHTSAGRLPTEAGLRLYVDGLLESAPLPEEQRRAIESRLAGSGRSVEAVLREASETLSELSRCAGLVASPAGDRPFKHVEFVPLSPGRALVILVAENGLVENRVIELPVGLPASLLVEAGNYLTTRLAGRSFEEACRVIRVEIEERRTQLDELTQRLVATGLATWAEDIQREGGILLVRGQAHLLDDVTNLVELERVRALFEMIEAKKNMLRLVEATQRAGGVKIFIGRENELFGLSGCSTIVAPYRAGDGRRSTVVGAIGVIGPTRLDYARVIPVVDYTARVVSRMLGTPESELEG